MNMYEQLQDEACRDGIDVVDYPFENKNINNPVLHIGEGLP